MTLSNTRIAAGSFCLFLAWIYPYTAGGSPEAMQQIFMLALLTVAALLIGLGGFPPWAAIVLLASSAGMLFSANPYWSAGVSGVAGLMLAGLACLVGAQLQRRPELLPWLLNALIAAAMINAAQGLLQWFGLVGELYQWVVEPEQRGVAYGAFRQRNLFATFLCVGTVCVIWLVQLRRLTEAMAWFLLSVLMLGVAASSSRTGVLESVALAALALMWRKQQSLSLTRLMVGQLALLGLGMVFLPMAAGWHEFGFTSGAARVSLLGEDARYAIWDNAVQLITERPLAGWGWREMGYSRYITLLENRFDGLLEHAHNLPLQLALEFGLPAASIFCGVLVCVVWRVKPWRKPNNILDSRSDEAAGQSFAWAILLFIVGIHSMLEFPLWSAGYLFLTGLWVGFLLSASSVGTAQSAGRNWVMRLTKFSAVGLLVLSLTAWQQYKKVLSIYKIPFTNDKELRLAAAKEALANASGSWLFQEHLDFATLSLTEVTSKNAPEVRELAEKLLHYSAEPRVIQPLLLSLWYQKDQLALRFHSDRFCRAFPSVFQKWSRQAPIHPMVLAMMQLSTECRVKDF